MKNNLRRLKWILRIFGIEKFFSISCDNYSITLYCYFKTDIVKKAQLLKFEYTIESNGMLQFTRGNYVIIMADKD